MQVVFTKLTDERHLFEVVREDGSRERAELETRSYLVHDLAHLAVESEMNVMTGFYGCLARGITLDQLNDRKRSPPISSELMRVEEIVAPFQSLYRGHFPRDRFMNLAAHRLPDIAHDAFVDALLERMRHLMGRYRALRPGESMALAFPPDVTLPK